MFRVNLYDAAGSPVLTTLEMAAKRWSDSERGGPDAASIEVSGGLERLAEVRGWLGFGVEIVGDGGAPLWWGFVNEVEIRDGASALSLSLQDLANRVAVAYTVVGATGANDRQTTAWASDAGSVTRFGTKEALLSLSDTTLEAAEALRTQALKTRAWPQPRITPDGSAPGATLSCAGWWRRLEWSYYQTALGREKFEADVDVNLPLAAEMLSNTLSWAAMDNLYDSANGLGWAQANSSLTVVGSAHNSRTWTVQDAAPGHINLDPDQVAYEAAGAWTVLAVGDQRSVAVAQSFRLSSVVGWHLDSISVQMGRVGNPQDDCIVQVRSDNSGEPGTTLATATAALAALQESTTAAVEFTFDGSYVLQPATTYWIVINRSGDASPRHYGQVAASKAAGYADGTCKVWNDVNWVAPTQALDVPFRIQGREENVQQVALIVAESGQLGQVATLTSSNRRSWLWRDGDLSSADEVDKLLRPGKADGTRLLATVDAGRSVRIFDQPAAYNAQFVLTHDRQLRTIAGGRRAEPGRLLAGTWIEVDSPVHDRQPVYVSWSQYDADRDDWTWRPAGVTEWFQESMAAAI